MNEQNLDVILMKESDNGSKEAQDERGDEEENKQLVTIREPVSPMQDINKAFEECKFGWFHIKLLVTGFSGFISSVLVTNTTSYLLPIAECDLNMNLKQKGLLNAMSYGGMFLSSIIAGFLTDTFGRIRFLRIGYGGLLFCTLLSALSQTYEMYAAAKLGEGFFSDLLTRFKNNLYEGVTVPILLGLQNEVIKLNSAIAISGVTSIVSEFCHPSVRDRVLLCLSSFAALAQIISPIMAWVILIQDWEWSLFNGAVVFKIWNFYLLAMAIWPLSGYILFTILPESPKFLVTRKKYREAREILIKVYTENTGKAPETFPYLNLWDREINEETKTKPVKEKATLKGFNAQVLIGLHNVKPLLQRPLVYKLIIISVMQLIVLGMYNVLRLWFPQLSTIVEHNKLDGNQNLCVLLDNYTATEKIRISNSTVNSTDVCVPHVSGTETYVNSIIIGLICFIPYFISGVMVNKLGKKTLLMLAGVITICALLGIRWANSKIMLVSLFSVVIAITQTMKALCQVVAVEVFPTTMRTFAMSLMMSLGRIGTLFGNIGFPILLAMGCEIPFYTMTVMMIGLILLAFFTPKKQEN